MNVIKVFICYSDRDKLIAGQFKKLINSCTGFEVFLAHEDIKLSENFYKEIRKSLQSADLVLPIVSRNLLISSFANQEIGIALGTGRKFVSVSIDGTIPKGFLELYQASKCRVLNEDGIFGTISELFSLFIQHPKFRDQKRAMDCLSYALLNSDSWKTTSRIISLILITDKVVLFDKEQLAMIVKAVKNNHEVFGADYVLPNLKALLKNHYGIDLT